MGGFFRFWSDQLAPTGGSDLNRQEQTSDFVWYEDPVVRTVGGASLLGLFMSAFLPLYPSQTYTLVKRFEKKSMQTISILIGGGSKKVLDLLFLCYMCAVKF